MTRWNEKMLKSEYKEEFNLQKLDWLGFPGATQIQIENLEKRIGMSLPRSYRSFLEFSNGWRNLSCWINQLLSTTDIKWFRQDYQDWIDAYLEPYSEGPPITKQEHTVYGSAQFPGTFNADYLRDCLQISNQGMSCIFLLNPRVKNRDDEWEAWFLDNKLPGTERFPSFEDLMKDHYQRYFVELLDD